MKRIALVLAALLSLAVTTAAAAPAAGTVIGNQATATYNDAGGVSRTATSNLVQTTVTQVKSFTLTANGARTAAPGQTVYYPHIVTNTGNGTDTYALNPPVSGNFGAGPHASLAYYADVNGDGVPDNGTPINTSGPLVAGGVFRFVVAGTVPAAAVSGDTATITVSVSDTTPATATNTDTTTVANSVISVNKAMSAASGPSPFGPMTVTLSYANTGTAAATNVQITDALPATLTYVAASGRWSVSGVTPLTDASDGVEAAGIDYRSTLGAGATITAIIASVPAGATANITFQVNVNAGLAPQTINNNAQYQTSTQLSANSNTASYQVLQGAGVVANGSNTSSANGVGEPVTVGSAAAGATFNFTDYVWNRGNGTDTFDMTVAASTFPPGTTVTLLQQDGATPLINSAGSPAPDTGPMPGLGQACPAPLLTDAGPPTACGQRIVVRVTLPANAPAGSYSLTLRATSVFNNTVSDDVIDTLGAVSANTVDLTNDRAAPPAGAAVVTDGLGASGSSIIRTNNVTPAPAVSTPTYFRVWVTNTGLVADNFDLAAVFAATSAAGVTPPALPAGWSVSFRADASGAPANCSAVGAPLTSTGVIATGAARLVCAEVIVPSVASGTALGGNYDFDFTATSATNPAVTDVIRDRVAVLASRNMTLTPDNVGQTFPNGTIVYTHTLTNNGNAIDTATFPAGCLADSRAAFGWTSQAYVDANANGTLEVGTDTPIVCGTTAVTLNVGESRAVFVRVTAPATATPAQPANVTTITATYVSPITATDTTSVNNGLALLKEQQALGIAGCANANPPAGAYSQAAIGAVPATTPGSCIAYRVTATNTTPLPITAITLGDVVPAGTRMSYACSGNGTAAPSITTGAIAGTTPPDGAAGTVGATVPALNAGQSTVLYFCVRIDPAAAANTAVANTATGTGTQGSPMTSTSNTTVALVGSNGLPPKCGGVMKTMYPASGPSPSGGVTVMLEYLTCASPYKRVVLRDTVPAGMRYVTGSGRWNVTGAMALSDGVAADDRQGAGPSRIAYDFGITTGNTVTASIDDVPAQTSGMVTFQVEVDAGLPQGRRIENTAYYTFYDVNGGQGSQYPTNTVAYVVTGRVDVELTGQRLASVNPGTVAVFTNVLTNRGDATDTFDITLGGSDFPTGTTFDLMKSDGVTPLADTDGNGTPDTGPVAPGATYKIVVRAHIPENALPAAYKVTKTARSARVPSRVASADDGVDTVAAVCRLVLDPDNQSLIGRGQHVTYTHYLTNRGNCQETVRAMVDYLGDSKPGWTSAAYIDNKVAGRGSLPGVVDSTDVHVVQGWSVVLQPGESLRVLLDSLRVLVDVHAPPLDAAAKAAAVAKAVVDSNLTTLVITAATVGPLAVRDTTLIDDKDVAAQPDNAIRNFTDASYATPTFWAVIGRDLFLRADAQSCNADPTVAESRTVVITGANGEREEVIAVETGPATGIFTVAALPVRVPPVVRGDRTLQGSPDDVFDIEILGCGRRIATVVTLMQPSSVVFDSVSNDPIAGASVRLVSASGSQCGTTAVGFGAGVANPAVTGADGRFAFPAVAGDYCLVVTPPNGFRFPSQVSYTQLSPSRNLVVTGLTSGGSYGSAFRVPTGGSVVVDMPLDGAPQTGLFVQKQASRSVAEIGDFIDYTVRVRNGTGNALDRADVTLTDDLPLGFAFVGGTARRDNAFIADPTGGKGPRLVLALGHLSSGQEVAVSYRVRIGPGAMQGDGTNRVQARYAAGTAVTVSNVASASVKVTGGVFSDKGFILGKVFMDCNANGMQDKGEEGMPGVRLVLEDGTWVLTDGGGKFSFYGLANRTHVLKADRTTLPAGARLATISARNLGDPNSRIVDLKSGEMQRADFAVAGCDARVVAEAKARREKLTRGDELSILAGTQLTTEARVITDVKALPASGVVEIAPATGFTTVAPANGIQSGARPTPAPVIPAEAKREAVLSSSSAVTPAQAAAQVPLEDLVPDLDNKLAIIGLTDGQILGFAQTNVRVKGVAGSTFKLSVNGEAVPEARVGKRAVLVEKQVQAWEYVGIDLKPGENTLRVVQVDSFGNERGAASLRVLAPGRLAKLVVEVPGAGGIADGKTPVKVVVKLSDAQGVPVTVRTPVTLAASLGAWQVEDADDKLPGIQTFIEGGRAEFAILPPLAPGAGEIVVVSGAQRVLARIDFLPELRNMIASGVIEGIVNARHISSRAVVPSRASDGFEQELRQLSREWNDGKTAAGARAAFFLKGKIKGEYLLTAAYDSDKDTRERLFRDIQPDEFYPIYGDSGTRGFDAQSTSKLYVRVDKGRSYLLWGDFTTAATSEARKLSNYNRSLTGVRQHYENDRVSVNAFASRDTTRQVIEELRANGTSGPFQLGTTGALVNSEKIEIITRDRNQPAIIISSIPQARFSDYEIESLTNRVLFKAPVASVDQNLNPVFVRITYEVDQGGPEFWVAGVDAQVKLGDRVEVGGVYVKDQNPLAPFTLGGANIVVKLGAATYVIGEVARSRSGVDDVKGDAGRLEIKHDGTDFKAQAFVAHTDRGFENPGAYLAQGRSEAGGKLDYKLSERTTLRVEALRTEDVATGSRRDGAAASMQYRLADKLTFELGLRHASEKGTTSPVPAVAGQPAPAPMPSDVTTVRARLTGGVPFVEGASVYGEAEVDVQDSTRRVLAAGGEYLLPNKGRIYARHEFISSITGPYGLNQNERQNTTAIGVDTEYMKDGRIFSEYRIRDAISGGDAEAAFGLKNLWSIAPGLRLGTSFERVHSLSGTGQNENTALALALEYTANPNWKGSTRLELRDGQSQESLLYTVGLAARIGRDWTALARNAYTLTRNKTGGGEHVIDRMQAGMAWRDNETNQWNLLARVESRVENDDSQAALELRNSTQIVSIHADWHPVRPFTLTGRYAAKWSQDKSNGLATRYRAQVVGGRATWEFAPKWDVGVVSSVLLGTTSATRQYAVGVEVGYLLATNLWVSGGYNFSGYRDADLAGADYTVKGPYLRLRYKFDETLLDGGGKQEAAR